MKDFWEKTIVLSLVLPLLILTSCAKAGTGDLQNNNDEKLLIVTSFTLIEDIVQQIGGELIKTHNLVPVGTDPHKYEALPEDTKAITDAAGIIYNGFNLEGGENGWLMKMIETVGKDESKLYELMEGAKPLYLTGEDGETDEINPHTFLDPVLGIHMAENTLKALLDIAPEHEEQFTDNAQVYIAELEKIHEEYEEKIGEISEEHRLLVTSERAYQYMAKRFGLEEGFMWEIDTE